MSKENTFRPDIILQVDNLDLYSAQAVVTDFMSENSGRLTSSLKDKSPIIHTVNSSFSEGHLPFISRFPLLANSVKVTGIGIQNDDYETGYKSRNARGQSWTAQYTLTYEDHPLGTAKDGINQTLQKYPGSKNDYILRAGINRLTADAQVDLLLRYVQGVSEETYQQILKAFESGQTIAIDSTEVPDITTQDFCYFAGEQLLIEAIRNRKSVISANFKKIHPGLDPFSMNIPKEFLPHLRGSQKKITDKILTPRNLLVTPSVDFHPETGSHLFKLISSFDVHNRGYHITTIQRELRMFLTQIGEDPLEVSIEKVAQYLNEDEASVAIREYINPGISRSIQRNVKNIQNPLEGGLPGSGKNK